MDPLDIRRFKADIGYETKDAFEGVQDHTPLFNEALHDDELFASRLAITSDAPVLALSTSHMDGACLLLMPQFQRKDLTLVGYWDDHREAIFFDRGRMYLQEGFVLDHAGVAIAGRLEEPIPIDYLDYNPNEFSEGSRRLIASHAVNQSFDDNLLPFSSKETARDLLQDTIAFPANQKIHMDGDVESAIKEFANGVDSDLLVFKPIEGLAGMGVEFFNREDVDGMIEHMDRMPQAVDEMYIEEFIQPFTMPDHEGFDSNIRAVSLGYARAETLGQLMVARVAPAGRPVNITLGGFPMHIDAWLEQVDKAGFDAEGVHKQMIYNQQIIRDAGVRTYGSDYILTDNGALKMLELNVGRTGALPLISRTLDSSNKVMSFLGGLVDAVDPSTIKVAEPAVDEEVSEEKVYMELTPSEKLHLKIRSSDHHLGLDEFTDILDELQEVAVSPSDCNILLTLATRIPYNELEELEPDNEVIQRLHAALSSLMPMLGVYDKDDQDYVHSVVSYILYKFPNEELSTEFKRYTELYNGFQRANLKEAIRTDDYTTFMEMFEEYEELNGITEDAEYLAGAIARRWLKAFRYMDATIRVADETEVKAVMSNELERIHTDGLESVDDVIDMIKTTEDRTRRRVMIHLYAKVFANMGEPADLVAYYRSFPSTIANPEMRTWVKASEDDPGMLQDPDAVRLLTLYYKTKKPKKLRNFRRKLATLSTP